MLASVGSLDHTSERITEGVLQRTPVWVPIAMGLILGGLVSLAAGAPSIGDRIDWAAATSAAAEFIDDSVLWSALTIAALVFTLAPIVSSLTRTSRMSVGSGAVVADARPEFGDAVDLRILRTAQWLLFVLTMIAYTQIAFRVLAVVDEPSGEALGGVVPLLLACAITLLLWNFEDWGNPWAWRPQIERRLAALRAQRARVGVPPRADEHTGPDGLADERRRVFCRSLLVPAVAAAGADVIVVVGLIVVGTVQAGPSLSEAILAALVLGAVLVAFVLAWTAIVKGGLSAIVQWRAGSRGVPDDAIALIVGLLSLVLGQLIVWIVFVTEGVVVGWLSLVVFFLPPVISFGSAALLGEYRVQSVKHASRLDTQIEYLLRELDRLPTALNSGHDGASGEGTPVAETDAAVRVAKGRLRDRGADGTRCAGKTSLLVLLGTVILAAAVPAPRGRVLAKPEPQRHRRLVHRTVR